MTELKNIHYVNMDDWEALYVNGELKDQGHSLDTPTVLRALGVSFDSHVLEYADPYKVEALPQRSEDLKAALDRMSK